MKKFFFPSTRRMKAFARDCDVVYFYNPEYSTLEAVHYDYVFQKTRDNIYYRSRSTVFRLPYLQIDKPFMFNGKEIWPGFDVFYLEEE